MAGIGTERCYSILYGHFQFSTKLIAVWHNVRDESLIFKFLRMFDLAGISQM